MANFCGNCGSPLDQTTGLCPYCPPVPQAYNPQSFVPGQSNEDIRTMIADEDIIPEAPISEAPVYEMPVYQSSVYEAPVYEAPAPLYEAPPENNNALNEDTSSSEKEKKKKRKLTKKGIIGIIAGALAGVLLIGGGVLGALWLFKDKGYSVAGKDYLFSNKYGTFYATGGGLINLEDVEAGPITDDDIIVAAGRSVSVDNSVYYAQINDNFEIHKADFEGETEVNTDVWMDEDDINDAFCDEYGHKFLTSRDWQHSDGYIYFTIPGDIQFREEHPETSFRIGRICIKDKSIELYDEEIRAASYVVDGKWIYYSDNGYDPSPERMHFNPDRAGIYKMKLDGSDQEKLLDFTFPSDQDYFDSVAFSQLSVFKNKLYFIDNTTPSDNRLCRMDTDGSDMEEVSSQGVSSYTIDTKKNKLYYITGADSFIDNRWDSQEIIELDLKKLSEETTATLGFGHPNAFQIICKDSTLYFHSIDRSLFNSGERGYTNDDGDYLVGLYYDLKKKEATGIYLHVVYEMEATEMLPGVITEKKVLKDRDIYTDSYDNDENFIEFNN